jgi:hypothetical protein
MSAKLKNLMRHRNRHRTGKGDVNYLDRKRCLKCTRNPCSPFLCKNLNFLLDEASFTRLGPANEFQHWTCYPEARTIAALFLAES